MSPRRPITRFYFMVPVEDMTRAVDFYVEVLGTELRHSGPDLSEVHLGDVTICLKRGAAPGGRSSGLMIEVADLGATAAAVVAGGGSVASSAEGAESVDAADTEGNQFTLVVAGTSLETGVAAASPTPPPPASSG